MHISVMWDIHYAQGRRCNRSMVKRQSDRRWRREKSAGVSSKTGGCKGSINDQKSENESLLAY